MSKSSEVSTFYMKKYKKLYSPNLVLDEALSFSNSLESDILDIIDGDLEFNDKQDVLNYLNRLSDILITKKSLFNTVEEKKSEKPKKVYVQEKSEKVYAQEKSVNSRNKSRRVDTQRVKKDDIPLSESSIFKEIDAKPKKGIIYDHSMLDEISFSFEYDMYKLENLKIEDESTPFEVANLIIEGFSDLIEQAAYFTKNSFNEYLSDLISENTTSNEVNVNSLALLFSIPNNVDIDYYRDVRDFYLKTTETMSRKEYQNYVKVLLFIFARMHIYCPYLFISINATEPTLLNLIEYSKKYCLMLDISKKKPSEYQKRLDGTPNEKLYKEYMKKEQSLLNPF